MNIVDDFRAHLFTEKSKPSKITVKNYVSDVRKFIQWYENTYQSPFTASQLTSEIIKEFQNSFQTNAQGSVVATRSAKRYISSLRKFCRFLSDSGAIEANPFDSLASAPKIPEDPWQKKAFKNYLIAQGSSKLTVKNYMLDIHQFLSWLEMVSEPQEMQENVFTNVNPITINKYKDRLMEENKFSATSINRKLSSLRRYLFWLTEQGFVVKQQEIKKEVAIPIVVETPAPPVVEEIIEEEPIPLTALKELPEKEEESNENEYSKFAPIRLFQKTKNAVSKGADLLVFNPIAGSVEAIQYTIWKKSGKKVFTPVKTILGIPEKKLQVKKESEFGIKAAQTINRLSTRTASIVEGFSKIPTETKPYAIRNISKSFYAPLSISLAQMSWQQRIIHKLRYVRPAWYKKYHSWPITHHIHLGVLMFAMAVSAYACFQAATEPPGSQRAAIASEPMSPPRTLAFQGRLLDKTNTPITVETPLRFAIYNSPTASGSALLWQEVQKITPNQDGYFSTKLGKNATISQQLISANPNIFVGIAVGSNNELKPRRQLATGGYATNSQALQGLKPITATDDTENVILALDSSGDLTIGGSASPTFQATGGQFTLSGQALLLTTNPGSNGNIQLTPDGSGIIDAQAPLQNTTNNNNLSGVAGALEIADVLAVVANTSSQSALVVKQNSTGDIISGFSNGSAKLRVDNSGNAMFSGNLTIGGNTITTNSTALGIANTNVVNLYIGESTSFLSLGGKNGVTTINNNIDVKGSTNLNGPINANGAITANGGMTVPAGKNFTLTDFTPGAIPFIGTSNQLVQDAASFSWEPVGKSFKVAGSMCVKATAGACAGNAAGTIYASNATVQAADLAENYISAQQLEPGDVVMPESLGNSLAIVKSTAEYQPQVIGIVSTKPGFTLNSDATTDAQHPNVYPLALQGRVPVKVSTMNGPIKAGDPLTSSTIPGVAMKATRPGQIIAKALEDYADTNPNNVGKVMSFVNISYQLPQSTMTNAGDLGLAVAAGVPTVSQEGRTLAATTTIASANGIIDSIKAKVIEAKEISTESLKVASGNVTINGKSLDDYIAGVVKGIVGNTTAETNLASSIINNITLSSSESASLDIIEPHATTAAALAPEASVSAEQTPIASAIASPAAIVPTLHNTIAPTVSPTLAQTIAMPTRVPSIAPVATDSAETASQEAALKSQIDELVSGDQTNFMDTLKTPSELGLEKLDTKDATVSNSLTVLGRTTLSDVGITGKVTIGLMSIDGLNDEGAATINTATGPLKFQSNGLNGVDFMNGKVAIDGGGNLNVNGNAFFAKDVTVKGTLAANIIAPIPGADLTVKNDNGKSVVKVSQNGDVTASGSGKFAGINIVRGAQADTSVTQTNANGSAGKGVIKANQKERTIFSPYVTKQSLIYVTATSDTQRTTPYVARQTAQEDGKGSFTVQIPSNVSKDITFNWWIVN